MNENGRIIFKCMGLLATFTWLEKSTDVCIFGTVIKVPVSSNPVTSYEGWNFNSGNYLFTTDTK